jgi:hypothetical protein
VRRNWWSRTDRRFVDANRAASAYYGGITMICVGMSIMRSTASQGRIRQQMDFCVESVGL